MLLGNDCSLCEQLTRLEGIRYYYECPDFVIIEDIEETHPVLIGRIHGKTTPPREAFKQANLVGLRLYGAYYTVQYRHSPKTYHYIFRILPIVRTEVQVPTGNQTPS